MSTITRSGTFPMALSAKRATPEYHMVSDIPPQPQRRSLKTVPPRLERTSSASDNDYPSILSLSTGSRVSVPSLDVIGTLRFLGTTQFKPGLWAGIELDAFGTGKNDGCVQGVRYFSCPPQSGLFIAASKIVPIKEEARLVASKSTRTSISGTTRVRPQPTPSRSTKSTRSSITSHRRTPSLAQSITGETAPKKTTTTKQRTPPPPMPTLTPDHSLELERELESAERRCKAHEEEIQRNNKKLDLIYDLLEKSEGDKDRLLRQLRDNEAALEGLVSTKESYKLRLEESEEEMARIQRELSMAHQNSSELQQAITEQEMSLAQSTRDNSVFESSQRRIQQLEKLVHELQNKGTEMQQQLQDTVKEHSGQIGQLRHELNAREEQVSHLEKECDEQEKARSKAVDAYEILAHQFNEQEITWKEEKEMDMSKLVAEIEALRQSQLAADDEGMQAHDMYADEWHDQRLRLEQQLELMTNELDRGRQQVSTLRKEADSLRTELKRMQQSLSSSDERFEALQSQLNEEVKDKRRLIEEAETALEAQARAEDDAYSARAELKETRDLILQYEADQPSNSDADIALLEKKLKDSEQGKRELEQECNRLMDEMLALEKAEMGSSEGQGQGDERTLRIEVEKIKQELEQRKKQCIELETSKKSEVSRLRDELAKLEMMVESKVFNEGDLEDALENERNKTKMLEKQVAELQQKKKKPSSKQRKQMEDDVFCEICDMSGHDVFNCNAFAAEPVKRDQIHISTTAAGWLDDEESY